MRDASGRVMAALASAACLAVVVLAIFRIQAELTRPPSPAEWRDAMAVELANRWQHRPVGTIFPDTLGYAPDLGGTETATRVGIGPTSDCPAAFDEALNALLKGCQGALRATYLDQTQGLVITVGLAAFPDPPAAERALKAVPTEGHASPGPHALGFPGSVVARFTDTTRQASAFRRAGPYLAVTSTGYTDGRTGRAKQKQPDLFTVAPQLAEQILDRLTAPLAPSCRITEYRC
ncbi:hypothetical protein [Actinocorallia longicatena]|uniref:Uncharacterized protein n=1 Tax=Actinocorallia longicatena TaxID=111803 RepID=A0ABP6Q0T0_9ACTN